MLTTRPASLIEGRAHETILEDGARRGVLRWRFATAAPGSTGPRPPGTTTRARGARCDRSGSNSGEGSAGPEPKIATVRAPGGERPPYWDARRLARCLACRVTCRPNGCLASTRRLSALRHPLIGVEKPKFQNPGAKNAPRERGRLFDERLPQVDGGGAKKQRREPSGRLQRQNSPSGEGCASENGIASCWTGPMPASGL